MKIIKLTKGFSTQVDDGDFEELSKYKWCASRVSKSGVYAVRSLITPNGKITIYMHRFIMQPEKGYVIDHIDGNALNNSRSNLRVCTQSENSMNKIKTISRKTTSKYKGVSKVESGSWMVTINSNKKTYYVGAFKTEKQAAMEYNKKAIELNGEFALLNIIS